MNERGEQGSGGGAPAPRATATVDRPAAEVAVALAKLRCFGAAVAEIGAALQIPRESLAAAEARDGLEATARVPVGRLAAPAFATLDEWFALLGDDLTIRLSLVGLDPDEPPAGAALEDAREPGAAFAGFRERAERVFATQGDDVTADVRLSIRKGRALAAARAILARRPEYLGSPAMLAATRVAVYYQAAAWDAALSLRAIAAWGEPGGLLAGGGRAVVLLCDAPGYLVGLALEVVGAASGTAPEWLSVSRAAWARFGERAAAERRLRDEEGGWADAPRALTPDYLRVASRVPGLEATAARLAWLRARLAAAELASAVQGSWDEGFALRFAGPRPASCRLDADAAPAGPSEGEAPASGALARLAAWAYRDASSEKLLIARECMARELPAGGEVALTDVSRAAVTALEAAKANLVIYVRRNIEEYFRLRQAAQDAVAAYAEATRKAVGDLTGDVVDNVYRTVGVLAGALLAGLLQPAASLGVLRLATALYAIYVAFVLGVVMRARRDRYRLERGALDERLAAMPELTGVERARLRRPAGEADAHFRRYFRLSAGIYAALGVLALVLFLLLWTPLAPGLALPHLASGPGVR